MTAEAQSLTDQAILPGKSINLSDSVVLMVSGVGRNKAMIAAQAMVTSGATALLSWGTAAALFADLQKGDLLLPETMITSTDKRIHCNNLWRDTAINRLAGLFKIHEGPIAETGKVLSSVREKLHMSRATGAIAADMESAAIGEIAEYHRLPFLVVRAVSDTSDMVIPSSIVNSIDSSGHMPALKVLTEIVFKPRHWATVAKLAIGMQKSVANLRIASHKLDAQFCCPSI